MSKAQQTEKFSTSKFDKDGRSVGVPTIHPDKRKALDDGAKHVGPLHEKDKRTCREFLETPDKKSIAIGQPGQNKATVQPVQE